MTFCFLLASTKKKLAAFTAKAPRTPMFMRLQRWAWHMNFKWQQLKKYMSDDTQILEFPHKGTSYTVLPQLSKKLVKSKRCHLTSTPQNSRRVYFLIAPPRPLMSEYICLVNQMFVVARTMALFLYHKRINHGPVS